MDYLSDLEICKRIAEIEGVKFTVEGNAIAADTFQVHELFSCAHMGFIFNPLTDDALCFKLIVKYGVAFDFYIMDDDVKKYYGYIQDSIGNMIGVPDCENLNMFICLAIIQAHKDTSND